MESSRENGPISGYEVRFYVNANYTTHVIDNTFINFYTVHDAGLEALMYGFSVAATNSAGVGKHSPIIWAFPGGNVDAVLQCKGW